MRLTEKWLKIFWCQLKAYDLNYQFTGWDSLLVRLVRHLKPVYTSTPNGSQTKCAYVWMGMRTCTAPFANGSHTICCELKLVGFLCKHKENWMRLHALAVLYSPQVREKFINRVPHTNSAARKRRALVYNPIVFTLVSAIFYSYHPPPLKLDNRKTHVFLMGAIKEHVI